MGRAALHNVRDIDLRAIEIDHFEHIVQKLSGAANKGFALQVLLLAGAFADKKDLCLRVTDAENDVLARFGKRAFPAAQTFGF